MAYINLQSLVAIESMRRKETKHSTKFSSLNQSCSTCENKKPNWVLSIRILMCMWVKSLKARRRRNVLNGAAVDEVKKVNTNVGSSCVVSTYKNSHYIEVIWKILTVYYECLLSRNYRTVFWIVNAKDCVTTPLCLQKKSSVNWRLFN